MSGKTNVTCLSSFVTNGINGEESMRFNMFSGGLLQTKRRYCNTPRVVGNCTYTCPYLHNQPTYLIDVTDTTIRIVKHVHPSTVHIIYETHKCLLYTIPQEVRYRPQKGSACLAYTVFLQYVVVSITCIGKVSLG